MNQIRFVIYAEPCELCGNTQSAAKTATAEQVRERCRDTAERLKGVGVDPCPGCLEAAERLAQRLEASSVGVWRRLDPATEKPATTAHAMKPTIHVTNWPSRKLHGPGLQYTIMARPRRWEYGGGSIPQLTPDVGLLEAAMRGDLTTEQYREEFMVMAAWIGHLKPGLLMAQTTLARQAMGEPSFVVVRDGDTICCSCSRAKAAAGECHRVWAAKLLHDDGWRVILDGTQLPSNEGERQE